MRTNLKHYLFTILIFFCLLTPAALLSQETTYRSLSKKEVDSFKKEQFFRFGFAYSPFQVFSFEYDKNKENFLSLVNMTFNVDYFFNKNMFISSHFGYLFGTNILNNSNNYDYNERRSHLYFADLSYGLKHNFLFASLGLGYSYCYYYNEIDDYNILRQDGYYHHFAKNINSSINLVSRVGVDFRFVNIHLRYDLGLSNLRDQEIDISNRSVFGMVFAINFSPSFD